MQDRIHTIDVRFLCLASKWILYRYSVDTRIDFKKTKNTSIH